MAGSLSTAAQQENAYVRSIDGLRAVAVLAVMIFHLAPSALPGGFAGVDIFFVISGYVVTASLVERQRRPLRQFILSFYARRIFRLFPALLICVLVGSIVAVAFTPPASWLGSSNSNTAFYAIFGLSNYALLWSMDSYFSPRLEFNPFAHTWSLGVEEQFYLIAPAIVYFWLAGRSQTGVKRIMPLAVLVLLALISSAVAAYNTLIDPDAAFYLLPSRFWELASGVLLFQIQHQRDFRFNYLNRYGAFLGLIMIFCALLFSDKAHFPFPWALASVAGTALLIASLTSRNRRSSAVEWMLSTRPAVYIGKLSYSLYLWHWPIFVMLRWTVGLDSSWAMAAASASTFLVAAGSYHFVEQPFRKLQLCILLPHWQTIAAGLAIMGLCSIATKSIYDNAHTFSLSQVKNADIWSPSFLPAASPGTCNVKLKDQPIGDVLAWGFIPSNCAGEGISRRLFVIGDSHTAAYKRMFFNLASEQDVEVWIYPIQCSVASLLRPMPRKPRDCLELAWAALEDAKAKGRPNDIVFLASLRMDKLGDQLSTFELSEVLARHDSDAAKKDSDAALDEARQYITRIRQFGFHVLIDAPKPTFQSIAFRCSDWFNKMNRICFGGTKISRRFLENHRQNTMRALYKLKSELPDIFIWDPFYPLCPGDQCSSWDGNGPLFFDRDHLSSHGSQVLYPFFRQTIENVWGGFRSLAGNR